MPEATFLDPDPDADRDAVELACERLAAFSPGIAATSDVTDAGFGRIAVHVDGLTRLWGIEERLVARIDDALAPVLPGAPRAGIDRQVELGRQRPDVRVAGQQAGRVRREEPGVVAGRDEQRTTPLGSMRGRDARGEARPRDPRPWRAREDGRQRVPNPRDEPLLDPPQAGQPVDVDGKPPERLIRDVARPGDARAEPCEPRTRSLDRVAVRVRGGIEEGRLGRQPVGAPERQPASHTERPRERVRVEDDPVRPGLAAEDDRAGRHRAGWVPR